jgi:hypothetical protein
MWQYAVSTGFPTLGTVLAIHPYPGKINPSKSDGENRKGNGT